MKQAFSNWRTTIYLKHKSINCWSKNEQQDYDEVNTTKASKIKSQSLIKYEKTMKIFKKRVLFQAWIDAITYKAYLNRKTQIFSQKVKVNSQKLVLKKWRDRAKATK